MTDRRPDPIASRRTAAAAPIEPGPAAGREGAGKEALNEAVRALRQPSVARERCANITAAVAAGESPHFTLDRSRLTEVTRRVARLIQERHASGEVPPHSRWRQFETGGSNRKLLMDARTTTLTPADLARARMDLAVVSVLLDADAGEEWHFIEPGGSRRLMRGEGLAVASFHAFMGGAFSTDMRTPLRVDAAGLSRVDTAQLARLFQVRGDNPLPGLEGRALQLQRLGAALRKRPDVFGEPGRPGRLFDLLCHARVGAPDAGGTAQRVAVRRISATQILRSVLKGFGAVWSSGQLLGAKPIGDAWPHPAAGGQGPGAGLVPFHQMAQWLAYSLVEPFRWAGIEVEGVGELTALPGYRSGGLLLDGGVIVPRDPAFGSHTRMLGDPWVVEWRALTLSLMDDLARLVRAELGNPALTLSDVMEGGAQAAGRQIAAERRPGGPPPVRVASNGALF